MVMNMIQATQNKENETLKKVDLKKKTVVFVDNGLFVDFARHCAKAFGKAYYYMGWQTYAVCSNGLMTGVGFDEMERIKNPLHLLQRVAKDDLLWVFLDVYYSDLQEHLLSLGCRVWGSRRGEEMELNRWEFKEHLKKLGLPVQHVEHIQGLEALKEYLKLAKDQYIKTSFVRGDFETFRHELYKLTEPRLDDLAHVFGPLKRQYEFITEDDIPNAVEVGYDGFTIDGRYPSHAMMAYEVKDVGMIGASMPYKSLAEPVRFVNEKLSETLKRYNYRGFLCTEIRYTKEKKPFLIDPCCRLGTPSNELLQALFDEWPQTLWHGAVGEVWSPKPKAKFAVAAVIHCEYAVDNWWSIFYPKEIEEFVKLRFHCRVDGVDWIVPQPTGLPSPGVILGSGETLFEAVKQCKSHAKEVQGYQMEVTLDSIDEALETIQKGEKLGVHFADELPTAEQLRRA